MTSRHLQIVVCGAGPASDVLKLVSIAQADGWTASVTATVAGLDFIDVEEIEQATGYSVRTGYRSTAPRGRVLQAVDALVVAPATFNTVNKLALGVADTYPLSSIAELIGRGVPTVIVPFVNSAFGKRAPFRRSVTALRDEGIRVLLGSEDGWTPHPPGAGADRRFDFPWQRAFEAVFNLAGDENDPTRVRA